MAVENLCLAAVAEGLGACTMDASLEMKKDVDAFPEYREGNLELLCGIAIGVPDHEPPKAPRQLEGRVTWLDQ